MTRRNDDISPDEVSQIWPIFAPLRMRPINS